MENKYFYTHPCQCKYWHEGKYRKGIVYKTSIVNAADGHPYDLDEIFESAYQSGIDEDDVITEFDMSDRVGAIYRIINKTNNKNYIGQTIQIPRIKRWYQHISLARLEKGSLLEKAIRKYGSENFIFEIIEDDIPRELLDTKEQEYIKLYNSYGNNGYNLTSGGQITGRYSIDKYLTPYLTLQLLQSGCSRLRLSEFFHISQSTIKQYCLSELKKTYPNDYLQKYKQIKIDKTFKPQKIWYNNKIYYFYTTNAIVDFLLQNEPNCKASRETILDVLSDLYSHRGKYNKYFGITKIEPWDMIFEDDLSYAAHTMMLIGFIKQDNTYRLGYVFNNNIIMLDNGEIKSKSDFDDTLLFNWIDVSDKF